jgi:hypothetical protein
MKLFVASFNWRLIQIAKALDVGIGKLFPLHQEEQ